MERAVGKPTTVYIVDALVKVDSRNVKFLFKVVAEEAVVNGGILQIGIVLSAVVALPTADHTVLDRRNEAVSAPLGGNLVHDGIACRFHVFVNLCIILLCRYKEGRCRADTQHGNQE